MALCNCLYEGMNLLLPPFRQRLILANQLLKLDVNSIKKSEKINLRLIMQSINDPKIIGILMQESCQDHEGIILDIIGLLKTLLHKDSQCLIQSLTNNDNAGDKTSSNLQSEERGLLFTIHTQFVLFNLNISPEFMMNFGSVKQMVLQYLKTLFKVRYLN